MVAQHLVKVTALSTQPSILLRKAELMLDLPVEPQFYQKSGAYVRLSSRSGESYIYSPVNLHGGALF